MADCKVRLQLGRVWLEVDAGSAKEAVQALSEYGTVFGERTCGRCGKDDLEYEHRVHDGHDYYALKCRGCGAQLDLGQKRDGNTLFPKRKLESGEYDREHRGWYKWQDRNRGGGGKSDGF